MFYNLLKYFLIMFCCIFMGCTTLKLKNDVLSQTDEDLTHGTEFVYKSSAEEVPSWIASVGSVMPDLTLGERKVPTHYELTIGQDIYTPSDLTKEEVIEGDNPYAGWLFGKFSRLTVDGDIRREVGLTLGITGKYSGAELFQKFVHDDLDMGENPMGWDNQLGTEVGLIGSHTREKISCRYSWGFMDLQCIDTANLRLGNIHTDFTYRNEFRLGKNLPYFDTYSTDWSSYYYVGSDFSVVGRNIFYDGNTFRDSHSVGSRPIIGRVLSGFVVQVSGWEAGFRFVYTSPEHDRRSYGHTVWILTLSKALQELFE